MIEIAASSVKDTWHKASLSISYLFLSIVSVFLWFSNLRLHHETYTSLLTLFPCLSFPLFLSLPLPRSSNAASLKTRMQVLSASPAATYTGMGQAFSRISSAEGARALWRGVASVIMGAGPAHAVYFGTYESVKEATGGNNEGHQFLSTGEFESWTQADEKRRRR